MKLLLTALLIFPLLVFSQQVQIKETYGGSVNLVGSAKEKTVVVSKLTYEVIGTDTAYTLTFLKSKNLFIADYQLLLFVGNTAVNQFYQSLKSIFQNGDKSLDLNINDMAVNISGEKLKGNKYVVITTSEGSAMLSEKQVDQTFGK